ncbi:MAG: cytochrome b/b6 domain-containing protein [Mucilaginibacter sp.]
MAVIEPVRMDVVRPGKVKRYSPSLRLWHWINTIIISGSLITVLINATITDDRTSSAIIKTELQQSGASVNDDQVRGAAHALSDSVWDIHKYFGYCLAGLLLFRLILEFFQLADQKFIRTIKSAYSKLNTIRADRETARHELIVKLIYAAFYVLLVIMVVTGLFLAFEDELRAYKAIRHSVKEVHNFCMYLILAFITVHLAGVFLAERKDSKGIVSDMINGGDAGA